MDLNVGSIEAKVACAPEDNESESTDNESTEDESIDIKRIGGRGASNRADWKTSVEWHDLVIHRDVKAFEHAVARMSGTKNNRELRRLTKERNQSIQRIADNELAIQKFNYDKPSRAQRLADLQVEHKQINAKLAGLEQLIDPISQRIKDRTNELQKRAGFRDIDSLELIRADGLLTECEAKLKTHRDEHAKLLADRQRIDAECVELQNLRAPEKLDLSAQILGLEHAIAKTSADYAFERTELRRAMYRHLYVKYALEHSIEPAFSQEDVDRLMGDDALFVRCNSHHFDRLLVEWKEEHDKDWRVRVNELPCHPPNKYADKHEAHRHSESHCDGWRVSREHPLACDCRNHVYEFNHDSDMFDQMDFTIFSTTPKVSCARYVSTFLQPVHARYRANN